VADGAVREVLRPDFLQRIYGQPFRELGGALVPDFAA
jgi:hypothetical protein